MGRGVYRSYYKGHKDFLVSDNPALRNKSDKVGGEFLTKEICPGMFSNYHTPFHRILDNSSESSNLGLNNRLVNQWLI